MPDKKYNIIDNGSIKYIAIIKPNSKIVVYKNKNNNPILDKKVLDIKYTKLFIGDNNLNDSNYAKKGTMKGNSLLVQIKENKYIYVGTEIYSFETKEEIKKYYSPIGNSFVPYPYAIGESFTYYMLDKKTIPNELLDFDKDLYGQYYGHVIKDQNILNNIIESKKNFRKIKKIK